jgi:hypothetical protein
MDYEVEWEGDEYSGLSFPYIRSNRRPRHIEIESEQTYGIKVLPEAFDRDYVAVGGTDLWLPRRGAFLAFGGDLHYDIVFVVHFDGVASTLGEVRYSVRPDKKIPVSTTRIRTIPLEPLLRRAVDECRIAYRKVGPAEIWRVSPEDRQTQFVPVMKRAASETRRRITDEQLQQVADIYQLALSEGIHPTKAVHEQLGLPSGNTAKKWVAKARAKGFLAPAPGQRRAGIR